MPKKRATYAVLALCLVTSLVLARSGNGAFAQGPLARTAPHALPVGQASWNVELVGQIGGASYAVEVDWPYAYIGVGPRLVILDVSDPTRPEWVGQTAVFPYVVQDLAVSRGMAYVIDASPALRIIDVSNAAAPYEVGAYTTPECPSGVAVSGGMAYAVDSGGLRIIDVSNPAVPHEVGACETPGWARDVAVSGDLACVTVGDLPDQPYGSGGLRIIDVSNPAAPHEVGAYDMPAYVPGSACCVSMSGKTAYVAVNYIDRFNSMLRTIDVSNPATPHEVGACDMRVLGYVSDIAVWGGMAYVAMAYTPIGLVEGHGGIHIIDVSNPAAPHEVAVCHTSGRGCSMAVAARGDVAYVADGYRGLRIIDVSNPAAPHEVGDYDTLGCARDVVASGAMAYVADGYRGLRVIDVSNPAAPHEAGACDTPGGALDVAVSGDMAYVTVPSPGDLAYAYSMLRTIDVSNPAAPHEVGGCHTSGCAFDVAVSGDTAYVPYVAYLLDGHVERHSGLQIIDVSNAAGPRVVGAWDPPGWVCSMAGAARGDVAYVAVAYMPNGPGTYAGLHIIDVFTPAAPHELGAWHTPGWHCDVAMAVSGGMAYLVGGTGLRIIDVSNPAAPHDVAACDTPGSAVAVSCGIAYVGGYGCLRIMDVSNPAAPHQVGAYDMLEYAYGVAVSGDMAYVAAGDGGLLIFRVTAPRWFLPVVVNRVASGPAREPTPTPPSSVFVWQQEAEDGALTPPMETGTDPEASECGYVFSPYTEYTPPGLGSVAFSFAVPVTGDYYVWTRAAGLAWSHDSFFVSVDNSAYIPDDIPSLQDRWMYGWQQVDSSPFALAPGQHTLCFAGREAYSRLDVVLVTNDPSHVPSSITPCATTAPASLTPSSIPTCTNTPTPTLTPGVAPPPTVFTPIPTYTVSPTPGIAPPPTWLPRGRSRSMARLTNANEC